MIFLYSLQNFEFNIVECISNSKEVDIKLYNLKIINTIHNIIFN